MNRRARFLPEFPAGGLLRRFTGFYVTALRFIGRALFMAAQHQLFAAEGQNDHETVRLTGMEREKFTLHGWAFFRCNGLFQRKRTRADDTARDFFRDYSVL